MVDICALHNKCGYAASAARSKTMQAFEQATNALVAIVAQFLVVGVLLTF